MSEVEKMFNRNLARNSAIGQLKQTEFGGLAHLLIEMLLID